MSPAVPGIAATASVAAPADKVSPEVASVSRPPVQVTTWRLTGSVLPGASLSLKPRAAVHTTADSVDRGALVSHAAFSGLRSLRVGDAVVLPLLDGRQVTGVVNLSRTEATGRVLLGGRLEGEAGGTFSLGVTGDKVSGTILPGSVTDDATPVYRLADDTSGQTWLAETKRGHIECVGMPLPEQSGSLARAQALHEEHQIAEGAADIVSPGLPAMPESDSTTIPQSQVAGVLFLDFDGAVVTDPYWNGGNTIIAASSGLSASEIAQVVRRVQEDYRPFNILVTSSQSAYDGALVNKRMRCIITSYSSWYGAVGGVARLYSLSEAGVGDLPSDTPCWVFSDQLNGDAWDIALAVAHEFGHTFGLSHDGLMDGSGNKTAEYYLGRGSGATSWGPIMGAPYGRLVTQWNDGDYTDTSSGVRYANNTEDDLTIIASATNHCGYVADTVGDTRSDAQALLPGGGTTVDLTGTIDRTGETDMYVFAAQGNISISVVDETTLTSDIGLPNLDASLTLYDASGAVLATANPTGSLYPSLSYNASASGVYYLAVTPSREGTLTSSGFSSYGSLGKYHLTGSIEAAGPLTSTALVQGAPTATAQAGSSFSYTIVTPLLPASFSASGLPAGLYCDADTGVISGVAMTQGIYPVSISVSSDAGTGSRTISLTVLPATAGEALDATNVSFTTGGDEPWEPVGDVVHDGTSSARSGQVMNNHHESWIETTVVGPGILRFWWRVSSELDYDFFRLQIDGTDVDAISGEADWALVTHTLSAGVHTLHWVYHKDEYVSDGTDQAWLDGVEWIQPPQISGPAAQRVVAGVAATFSVQATHVPTHYLASGLPAGLGIDPDTGIVSGTATTLGTYSVTYTVINDAGSDTYAGTVRVVGGYTAFIEDSGVDASAESTAADPDGDGLPNLIEYAFGLDANVPESTGPVTVSTVAVSADDIRVQAEFTMPLDRPDLRYIVEFSSDLVNWTAGHSYGSGTDNSSVTVSEEVLDETVDGVGQHVIVRDASDVGSRRFVRVRIEQF